MELSCSDGFRVVELLQARGWAGFRVSNSQQVVLVTHCTADGQLPHLAEALGVMPKPDMVVCCFPAIAKERHPELPIYGDWHGESRIEGFLTFVEVGPLEH
jgi:hypothetical protein